MKNKIISILCILFCAGTMFAQPIGNPPVPNTVPNDAVSAWYRGGNNPVGAIPATSNVFGTSAIFNSGIYTETFGINRTRLNGTQNALISGVVQNVDGFFGIGPNGFFATNSPQAMLHLQGPDNSGFGGGGWRKWMRTGMFANENSDAMYVGLKNEGPGVNRSDAIINWSDDPSAGGVGADKLRFVFTGAAVNPSSTNPLTPLSLPGYEYMRLVSSPTQANSTGARVGNVGIGPVFTDLLPPTNRLHMNAEEDLADFMQITNQNGTGQTVNDGLHVGYAPTSVINKEAVINQKENDRLTLYANNGERIRIMQIGALNNGIAFNPGALPTNLTRISISEDPGAPITSPMSLLHIGYNTIIGTDGWRPWMDVGMYASKSSDNMYIGLKAEPGIGGGSGIDKQDAVINWGDNPVSTFPTNGPDNLRFIFTANALIPGGVLPATGPDGLEGMRMTPSTSIATPLFAHVWTGIGGDPNANLYVGGSINPTQTLEVNSSEATTVTGGSSGLRFTNLNTTSPTIANPGKGVLAVNNLGDVIYVPGGGNGLGNLCGTTPTNPLPGDWEIPMADHNYHFSDNGSTGPFNNVGIGTNCSILNAKLVVQNSVRQFGINSTTATANFSTDYGIRGNATNNFIGGFEAIGVEGNAINAGPIFNTGVNGNASGAVQTNYGGKFLAFSPSGTNMGIQANGNGASGFNYGVNANGNFGFTSIGVSGTAGGATSSNYGVIGTANTTNPANRAGKFVGVLESTTGLVVASDQMFKTNVVAINNATGILKKLKPHSYDMDIINYPQFNFESVKQYGFIAQEIETVLPELVQESKSLEELDSTGVVIHPSIDYKSVNYNALIPITVQAVNELSERLDKSTLSDQTIKTNVLNLIGSLAKVKQMRGVTYEWSNAAQSSMNLDSIEHIGFIAQEVNAIEPLLTFVDDSSLMHVNYDRVVPMLVESIKDLDNKILVKDSIINALKTNDSIQDYRLTTLENAVNNCCNTNHSMLQNSNSNSIGSSTAIDVNLKDGQTIVLEQNVPNPFAEQTTINYFLPENVAKAQMLFYNAQGKLIQSVDLNEKGKGSLNVFASDLSNGIYTYTLVVDGKIIETKKMMKQQ